MLPRPAAYLQLPSRLPAKLCSQGTAFHRLPCWDLEVTSLVTFPADTNQIFFLKIFCLYTAKLATRVRLFWSKLPWPIGEEEGDYLWYNKITCNGITGRITLPFGVLFLIRQAQEKLRVNCKWGLIAEPCSHGGNILSWEKKKKSEIRVSNETGKGWRSLAKKCVQICLFVHLPDYTYADL